MVIETSKKPMAIDLLTELKTKGLLIGEMTAICEQARKYGHGFQLADGADLCGNIARSPRDATKLYFWLEMGTGLRRGVRLAVHSVATNSQNRKKLIEVYSWVDSTNDMWCRAVHLDPRGESQLREILNLPLGTTKNTDFAWTLGETQRVISLTARDHHNLIGRIVQLRGSKHEPLLAALNL